METNSKESSCKLRTELENKWRRQKQMRKMIIQRREMKESMMMTMMLRMFWKIKDLLGCYKLRKMEKEEQLSRQISLMRMIEMRQMSQMIRMTIITRMVANKKIMIERTTVTTVIGKMEMKISPRMKEVTTMMMLRVMMMKITKVVIMIKMKKMMDKLRHHRISRVLVSYTPPNSNSARR